MKLRHQKRMTLERLATVDDGFGDAAPDRWETVNDIAVQLTPASNASNLAELITAEQIASTVTHMARTKYQANCDSAMRLRYGDRLFNVNQVTNDMERNKFLVWQLTEVANG